MPVGSEHPGAVAAQFKQLVATLCAIAEAYYDQGRLDDGLRLLQLGAQIAETADVAEDDRTKLLVQYGRLLVAGNIYGNADDQTTLAVAERARRSAETAAQTQLAPALDLLGQAHYYQALNTEGDYDFALEYFRQALEHHTAAADRRGIAETLFHIGMVYERKEQYDQARAHYIAALDLANEHGYTREKANALRHLGRLAVQRGDLDGARQGFEETLALREQAGPRFTLPFAHMAVGDVYLAQGSLGAAIDHYQSALALGQEMGLRSAVIFALISLGYVRQDQAELAEAGDYFERAAALAEAIGHRRGRAEVAAALAELAASDSGSS
jgi:tetratricopeptide (TPR) repeat protein